MIAWSSHLFTQDSVPLYRSQRRSDLVTVMAKVDTFSRSTLILSFSKVNGDLDRNLGFIELMLYTSLDSHYIQEISVFFQM